MTGPEHYLEAERLLSQIGEPNTYAVGLAAQAQVHATLALAAATLDSGPKDVRIQWLEEMTHD